MTTGYASKFDAATNLNVTDTRNKARPSTEVGRMRARRATEPMTTTDLQGQDGPLADQTAGSTNSRSASNTKRNLNERGAMSSMHTPRFSHMQRNMSSFISLDRSDI